MAAVPLLATSSSLAHAFAAAIHAHDVQAFDAWFDRAALTDVPARKAFTDTVRALPEAATGVAVGCGPAKHRNSAGPASNSKPGLPPARSLVALTKKEGARSGIEDRDIRRLLESKSPSDLARFLLKGVRENKAFRRKVLAWLINDDAEALPKETVLGEIDAWIEDAFNQRSLMPRTPNLKELNPVRSAVRGHPDLAVPTHLEIVDQIAGFLDAYGGGPTSLYDAIGSSYREAAANLPQVADASQQETYLRWMEEFAGRCGDFGYGLDSETGEVLDELREHLASETAGIRGSRRR